MLDRAIHDGESTARRSVIGELAAETLPVHLVVHTTPAGCLEVGARPVAAKATRVPIRRLLARPAVLPVVGVDDDASEVGVRVVPVRESGHFDARPPALRAASAIVDLRRGDRAVRAARRDVAAAAFRGAGCSSASARTVAKFDLPIVRSRLCAFFCDAADRALGWPGVSRTRRDDEATCPGSRLVGLDLLASPLQPTCAPH
eukprot:5917584-Prymnesium_polylepis.1